MHTVQATQTYSSVDGVTVTLDFQGVAIDGWLSDAPGWSSSETISDNRPDGYTSDNVNTNNILGMIGGVYTVPSAPPSATTTVLTYNFDSVTSNRYEFKWTQNIAPSQNSQKDVFGWKFLSGGDTAFEIKFLTDTSMFTNNVAPQPDLVLQGYNGSGSALSLSDGQKNLQGIFYNDADNFRLTADLANKTWTLDVMNKSNNAWYMLVTNAVINSNLTSLNGMAATWTVTASNGVAGAGDNFMAFDNITIQGKQTVTINLNLSNTVYNGSAQTVGLETTPTNIPVVIKYNGSTNAPTNAATYVVTAEVVDTNAYYNAPTSGSWVIAKATPTIATNPTASAIWRGQSLTNSHLNGGSATGVGGISLDGAFAFSSPSFVPTNSTAGTFTASVPVTFTPSDSNYAPSTANINVTVQSLRTSWDAWADSLSLTGGDRSPTADPDQDGFINTLEFAFGTDPAARTGELFSATTVGSNYVVTFKKRKLTSDATYEFRSSTDLTQAFSDGTPLTTSSPTSVDADYEQVTVSIPMTGERGFIRGQANVLVGPSP